MPHGNHTHMLLCVGEEPISTVLDASHLGTFTGSMPNMIGPGIFSKSASMTLEHI